jgi:hypothetical protein
MEANKAISENRSNIRDCFKIARSLAERVSKEEDNHEVLVSRIEALEFQVQELANAIRSLTNGLNGCSMKRIEEFA